MQTVFFYLKPYFALVNLVNYYKIGFYEYLYWSDPRFLARFLQDFYKISKIEPNMEKPSGGLFGKLNYKIKDVLL